MFGGFMRVPSLAFSAILFAIAAGPAAAQQWTTLSPAEDGFSIDLPGTAKASSLEADPRSMLSHRMYTLDQEPVAWIVNAARFKAQVNNDGFLNAVIGGAKGQCEIRDERRTSYPGGMTADFVLHKCPDGRVMRMRIFAHGDHLYQAIVVGPPGVEDRPETRRAIESFKVAQAAPSAPAAAPPAPAAAAPVQWQTFASAADGFAVDFPGTPESIPGNLDPAKEVSDRRWAVSRDGTAWLVAAVQFKERLDPETALNGGVAGVKGSCEINDERRTSYPGGITTDFIVHKCPDGTVMRARLYAHGEWFYQALVVGREGVDARPETKRFFDSFKLMTPQQRPAVAAAPPAAAPSRSDRAGAAAGAIVQPSRQAAAPSGGGRAAKPADDDNWGALAIDITDRDLPWGSGEAETERDAVNNAMRFCRQSGGKACKVVLTFRQCGAYAHSRNATGTGVGKTKKAAETAALEACKDSRCQIVTSDCNEE